MKLAEEQKKRVIGQVNKLRKRFKLFQTQNDNLPGHIQLGEDDFIMDEQVVRNFKAQTEENLKIVGLQQNYYIFIIFLS